jgi:hypothetical protein
MGEQLPERLPMGHMGMNPAAAQATMRTPSPARPNPRDSRAMEQAILSQRMGIGSVPPRRNGGRTK